jgi:hypothetical protein
VCSGQCDTIQYKQLSTQKDDMHAQLSGADAVTTCIRKVLSALKGATKAASDTYKAADRYGDALMCEVKNKDFERAEVVRYGYTDFKRALVCTRTHTHSWYTHTYIYTYIRTYIPTHVHTYIHTYTHACIHTYDHTYAYAHTRAYICTCIHTYKPTHTCIRTYISTYGHTYDYIQTYKHT